MKAIHLTAYGNPAQSLMMVEVSEPNTPSANEALVRMEYAPIANAEAARLINLFDRYSPEKAVVVPPADWDHE